MKHPEEKNKMKLETPSIIGQQEQQIYIYFKTENTLRGLKLIPSNKVENFL